MSEAHRIIPVRRAPRCDAYPLRLLGVRSFTLVEVMIVVVILAIVALLATPMLGATDMSRLIAASRLLMADLGYAQTESIAHATDPCGVKFDSVANSYSLVKSTTPGSFNCSSVTVMTNPADQKPYTTTYGTGRGSELGGVTIDSYSLDSDACVVFGSFGGIDQATPATVTLRSGAVTLTITIDPVNGEATVP